MIFGMKKPDLFNRDASLFNPPNPLWVKFKDISIVSHLRHGSGILSFRNGEKHIFVPSLHSLLYYELIPF